MNKPKSPQAKKECKCVYPNAVFYHKGYCKFREDSFPPQPDMPGEYNWEKEFDNRLWRQYTGSFDDQREDIKSFIKQQIDKAELRGYKAGLIVANDPFDKGEGGKE